MIFVLFLLIAQASFSWAGELKEFYRGARAQAMGNAYVGLADDEQTLFLNPAGLAGVEKASVHYLLWDLDVSDDVIQTLLGGETSQFTSVNAENFQSVMGKNYYGRSQLTPTILMPNFGISLMIDDQIALSAQNQSLPQTLLGYQMTNGLQAGFGLSLSRGKLAKIGDLRVGIAGKVLFRRGGYRLLTFLDQLNFGRNTLGQVGGDYHLGKGVDLGVQFIRPLGKGITWSLGSSVTDVGDTSFGFGPDPVKQNFTIGTAFSFRLGRTTLNVAYDYKHINLDADWRKKSHFGAELAMPFISLYGGFNQTFLTYGFAFDAWIFRITALSYAEEQGVLAFQDSERRYMLRLALKFGL